KLMNEGEASKVGAFTFLVPILSVIVSSIFLGEAITFKLFIGMMLVGGSIYLVNRKVPATINK
ncbi:EamA family transporter, partial [Butyricicoccus sp. 1XD8-22]